MSWTALLISTAVLTALGVTAGMIPAIRAARLDPVRAIRSE